MGVDIQMLVKIKGKDNFLTPKQVWDLSYRVCEAFGHDYFYLEKESDKYSKKHHALEIVEDYEQDGPDIVKEDDEQFITVHTLHRYYGEGYERGPLPFVICLAWYLEEAISHSEVFYGGDSSGVLAEKFGRDEREKLFKYFVKKGHLPYISGWDSLNEMTGKKREYRWCNFCDKPLIQYGFGPQYAAYRCPGCGFKEKTEDGGKNYIEVTKED